MTTLHKASLMQNVLIHHTNCGE